MPEKVHTKFGEEPSHSATSQSGAKPEKQKENNPLSNGNAVRSGLSHGKKRSFDGTPKELAKSFTSQTPDEHIPNQQTAKKPKFAPSSNGRTEAQSSGPIQVNGANPEKKKTGVGAAKPGQAVNKSDQNGTGQFQLSTQEKDHLWKTSKALEATRANLPIWSQKANIRYCMRWHDVMLLHGETGSGKSTQVPQFLYTEPWCRPKRVSIEKDGKRQDVNVGGVIAITQPRRIAAMTLAQRVAREMGSPLTQGQHPRMEGKVGFSVRFETLVPRGTRIKFVTEGTLLQEMLHDPYLTKYSAIVVDEVHERSVDVDLICGFLRQIIHGDKKGRGGVPLKVVLMSATMDLGGIEAYFAKPGWDLDYVPGQNYGKEHTLRAKNKEQKNPIKFPEKNNEKEKPGIRIENTQMNGKLNGNAILKKGLEEKDRDSRRSSMDTTYSSWDGFSDDDEIETKAAGTLSKSVTKGDIEANGVGTEYVRGRQYSVEVKYEKEQPHDILERVFHAIMRIHRHEAFPGDILAFVTGQDDIETLIRLLDKEATNSENKSAPRMKVLPLYGSLAPEGQQAAFEPVREKFTRKIVVATNIAETSVTVSGVRYVVDCGMVKMKQYRTQLGMDSLLPTMISKNSAEQRLGRAAREARGHCWRIYTKEQYESFKEDDIPEILRSSALEAVLKMKARGVEDPSTFPLMDTPDTDKIMKALGQLVQMGALDSNQKLTATGQKMAALPLPAQYGCVLIAAADSSADCLLEAIDIISLLTTESEIFINPKSEDDAELFESSRADITRREGDLITLLTTMQRYTAENADRKAWCEKRYINYKAMRMATNIRKQLHSLCFAQKLLAARPSNEPGIFEPTSPEAATTILKTFLGAFSSRTATLQPDGSYKTLAPKNTIAIHPSSVLYGRKLEAIMFLEHVFTKKNYAKKVSAIQAGWILEAIGSGF